eukprot:5529561-Ditylum_brightwellii.AAC.1
MVMMFMKNFMVLFEIMLMVIFAKIPMVMLLDLLKTGNRVCMSPNNAICIDNSDDDVSSSSQPSVVPSDPVQSWKETVANMVETKTKDTVAAFFSQMQENNPGAVVKNMVAELLSQTQMKDKSADKKKAAKLE